MVSHTLFYLAGFFLTTYLIHVFRFPAIKIGLVDHPGGRKQHSAAIPLIGGIAIFCSFSLIALLINEPLRHFSTLFAGMGILLITGILDDLHDISAKSKFLVQLLVSVLLVSMDGNHIGNLGNLIGLGDIILSNWSIPFTILCVVGLINAVNMVDGMDGLAGGIVTSNFIALAVLSYLAGYSNQYYILPLLCAVTASFLFFNYRTRWRLCATVFMGDAGSMMLGFALAWLAIDLYITAEHTIPAITFGFIFAIPVFDTISLIIRRTLKRQHPFAPDREHLHHIFMRAGYSYNATVNLLLMINIFSGSIGIAGWYFQIPEYILFLLFLAIFLSHLYFVLHAWRFMRALKRLRRMRTTN